MLRTGLYARVTCEGPRGKAREGPSDVLRWECSDTGFVLDALEQALYDRRQVGGALVHHSDCGSQYVAIKYTELLAEAGIEPSVGSVGDSYDNALAETINGLYKAELIHRKGPGVPSRRWSSLLLDGRLVNNRRLMGPTTSRRLKQNNAVSPSLECPAFVA